MGAEIRTRFSPSPTGMIHLGNIRTALYSYLFAAQHQGIFILRIEDTDVARSKLEFVQALQFDLHWLGLNWQEGPDLGGEWGPYYQSQRQAIYAQYYTELEQRNLIYPCFCTDQELLLTRKMLLAQGRAPRYLGKCRQLSQAEIAKRIASGQQPAWRFQVPSNQNLDFVDVIKGPQHFNSNDIGDFIVRRADKTAPFLFCNAIDDALMQVSHSIRGEDHLANTPRQIMILQVLNLPVPNYGHLPMIVGNDGAPLSKRHGSFSIYEMRHQGYLPSAILNYLARLGHTYATNNLLEVTTLAAQFNLAQLSTSAARFDVNQLHYWQRLAISQLNTTEFTEWLGEEIIAQIPVTKRTLFIETIKPNIVFPYDTLAWIKIFFSDYSISSEVLVQLRQWTGDFFERTVTLLESYVDDFSIILSELQTGLGMKGKKLYLPLRLAFTGRSDGPELAAIAKILGKNEMQARIRQVITAQNSE